MSASKGVPKVKVYLDTAGAWRWSLVAGNNEIQCPSQGYKTKGGALAGWRAVVRNAPRAVVVVVKA